MVKSKHKDPLAILKWLMYHSLIIVLASVETHCWYFTLYFRRPAGRGMQ